MPSSGMLHRVAVIRIDISEELCASIIRVKRIYELGTLAVTSNQRALGCWLRLTLFPRRLASSGTLRHVALIATDVLEEFSASFIRVTRMGELGTTLA
jgi:hypothetical protein